MARRLDDGRLRSFAPVIRTIAALSESPCLTATGFVVAYGKAHQRQGEVSGNALIFEERYPYYSKPLSDSDRMPRSKTRNKKYTPRPVKLPSLLNNLSMPQTMVARFNEDTQKRLLRFRLSGINEQDLASLVFSFAQAWMLSEPMNEAQALRSRIEAGVYDLKAEVAGGESTLSEASFDLLADLMDLSTVIVAESTRNEYLRACCRLRGDENIPFVEEFLIALAEAKLLAVVHDAVTESMGSIRAITL